MKVAAQLLILSLVAGTSSWAHSNMDLPAVPVSVLKNVHAESSNAEPQQKQQNEKSQQASNKAELMMTFGVNQIVEIAIGHPNRIITPFMEPEITSTSLVSSTVEGECGEVCIKDNVIYIATSKASPVTMFITDKGSEARALSLTMIPLRIPPREILLNVEQVGGNNLFAGSSKKAETWEKSQPYVETITAMFKSIALGEVPTGFSIGKIPVTAPVPSCSIPWGNIDFSRGQLLMGHNLAVFVGVLTNVSEQPAEFKEILCGGWDVAAVTSWPHTVLKPQQSTEVYIAKKYRAYKDKASSRPSLLEGN